MRNIHCNLTKGKKVGKQFGDKKIGKTYLYSFFKKQ